MLVECQECSAVISNAASACPKCGAPPRVFLAASFACAECGESFQAAWSSCRYCGAPRDVAASVATAGARQVGNNARVTQENARAPPIDREDPDWLRTSGRTNRQAFIVALIVVTLVLLVVLSFTSTLPTDRLTRVGIVAGAMTLLLPATIERLHDIGWSGWLAPVIFFPGGFLLFVLLAILPGTNGPNQYGPPPEIRRS